MPLNFFRFRNLTVASVAGVFWAAAMFAWFFVAALYLQLVLGYSPQAVGLAFLPANIIMALFSIWLSAWSVIRFGIRKPIAFGLGLAALGMFWFARAPIEAVFWWDIFPSMALLGIGGGLAFNPMLLAAMGGIPPDKSGLASGLVNTAFMMGGSIGLAILVSISAIKTSQLSVVGLEQTPALLGGYHLAFLVGGIFALIAAFLGGFVLTEVPQTETTNH